MMENDHAIVSQRISDAILASGQDRQGLFSQLIKDLRGWPKTQKKVERAQELIEDPRFFLIGFTDNECLRYASELLSNIYDSLDEDNNEVNVAVLNLREYHRNQAKLANDLLVGSLQERCLDTELMIGYLEGCNNALKFSDYLGELFKIERPETFFKKNVLPDKGSAFEQLPIESTSVIAPGQGELPRNPHLRLLFEKKEKPTMNDVALIYFYSKEQIKPGHGEWYGANTMAQDCNWKHGRKLLERYNKVSDYQERIGYLTDKKELLKNKRNILTSILEFLESEESLARVRQDIEILNSRIDPPKQ